MSIALWGEIGRIGDGGGWVVESTGWRALAGNLDGPLSEIRRNLAGCTRSDGDEMGLERERWRACDGRMWEIEDCGQGLRRWVITCNLNMIKHDY